MKLDALAPTLQSFLAFDFGTRRIGVASGTRLLGAAEPRATVKGVLPRDLSEMGARIVLGNTYHLYLRPGDALVARHGGLHRFMGWDGPTLTDSGGYQVFSLGDRCRLSEAGAEFRSHLDGSRHLLTPESAADIQSRLGVARKTVAGHVESPVVRHRIAAWARAALGRDELRRLRLVRFGDNMRDVAVTEGDKVDAQLRFGVSVNTYGVNDLVASVDRVVQVEAARLVQLHQHRVGEELGDRSDTVDGFGGGGQAGRHVGAAETGGVDHLLIGHDGHRDGRHAPARACRLDRSGDAVERGADRVRLQSRRQCRRVCLDAAAARRLSRGNGGRICECAGGRRDERQAARE